MKSRLSIPDLNQLSERQRQLVESILHSRGSLDGPFFAWLHSPEFASRAEQLGAFCRYATGLAAIESELLILLVATSRRCQGEWQIHAPLAAQAGLPAATIADIASGSRPAFQCERLTVLYELATQLLTNDAITATTYRKAEQLLGIARLVETVGIIGYYSLVAYTLNAFEMTVE